MYFFVESGFHGNYLLGGFWSPEKKRSLTNRQQNYDQHHFHHHHDDGKNVKSMIQ